MSGVAGAVQGYLAYKNPPPRRTLQEPFAYGPMVILGGWVFLMSEVALYTRRGIRAVCLSELGGYCRANVAHIRQSTPDSGLGSQAQVLENF